MNQYETQQPISAQPKVQPEQVQATDPITQAALATAPVPVEDIYSPSKGVGYKQSDTLDNAALNMFGSEANRNLR